VGLTNNGIISANSGGYQGANGVSGAFQYGKQGEGTPGPKDTVSIGNNGSGGGGGAYQVSPYYEGGGGGGGGHATDGVGGADSPFSGKQGYAGTAVDSADLTTMSFGGGGGSGATGAVSANSGAGGASGGLIVIFTSNLTNNGTMTVTGVSGNAPSHNESGGGGDGSGGAILLEVGTATLGSSTATALKGTAAATDNDGGDASNGIISIHYSSNITGTTNPTYTQTFDGRLVETGGAILFMM
jgi:hypothetical protein